MKYQLTQNLGLDDAKRCNDQLKCSLPLDAKQLSTGSTVELSDVAAKWLTEGKGYTGLLAPLGIKGEAKKPEITAPAK